jgi:hypothetical protein
MHTSRKEEQTGAAFIAAEAVLLMASNQRRLTPLLMGPSPPYKAL